MKLFDLHCDTAFEIFKEKTSLFENSHDISVSRAEKTFDSYAQVMAIWTNRRKSDEECFHDFLLMRENLLCEAEKCVARICLCGNDVLSAWKDGKSAFFIAVEGARILCGDINRVDMLYDLGVRFMTLTWGGSDIIGGSHDTDAPLTEFGREAVRKCMKKGIVVDISHASRAVTRECLDIAKEEGKPIIATHSDSYFLNPIGRNLTDGEAIAISSLGGVIGISLAPEHLCKDKAAGIDDIIAHVKHYISLGLSGSVCFGCDFDGIASKPRGINDISSLKDVYYAFLEAGIPQDTVDDIFYRNAERFVLENLPFFQER